MFFEGGVILSECVMVDHDHGCAMFAGGAEKLVGGHGSLFVTLVLVMRFHQPAQAKRHRNPLCRGNEPKLESIKIPRESTSLPRWLQEDLHTAFDAAA